ncbi:MAG TPA: MFS transporter [Vicinamibacterales bacterium]|nr:MFS transporter [Vicinamibacterales bacterium]
MSSIGRVRWTICGLLFAASTVNYIDRQVLGILAPDLQRSIGWNEAQYGYIVTAFQAAYAIGFVFSGRLMDWLGSRRGYAIAVGIWSIAAMAHGLATSAFTFGAARFGLGLGESGSFPAAVKTTAEWFPRKERAFATGIFNSGTNIGAIVAPLTVPWIALSLGWRWAFVFTGAIGFVWIAVWLVRYAPPAEHRSLSHRELDYIRSDREPEYPAVGWKTLLMYRQTWAIMFGKFMTDPIWWFYLFWLPKFLHDTYGLTLSTIGAPLVAIYVISDVGSIAGGWLSSRLIARGWTVNAARKTTMLTCAVLVVPIVFASSVSGMWGAVAIIGLAAAAHQGFSANMFTLASDMFPREAVGSMTGLGGMAGAIGGMVIATAVGWLLQLTGSYVAVFLLAPSSYFAALLFIHILAPRLSFAFNGTDQHGFLPIAQGSLASSR